MTTRRHDRSAARTNGKNGARHATAAESRRRRSRQGHHFVVDDIELAIQRALQAGATPERDITLHQYGKLALMADPFGHGFCFIQFTGQGYDELPRKTSKQ